MLRLPTIHRRLPLPSLLLWVVGVAGWVWGVAVVVRGGWRVGVGQVEYVMRTWREEDDPKLPRPLRNPYVLRATIQESPEDAPWDPQRLQEILDLPTSTCRRLRGLGGQLWCGDCHTCLTDGNKYTCFDPDVRPVPGACIVYSVGVGAEISWDSAIARFNCSIFAMDMTLTTWTNGMLRENLHFLDVGLADFNSDDTINMTSADGDGANKKWEWRTAHFRTLETLRDILGHNQRTIDILKLDIEHWEWDVLGGILTSPTRARILDDVKQIALEIHLDGFKNASTATRVAEGRRVERVLRALYSRGFHLVHTELNTAQQVYAEVKGHVFPLYRESLFVRRP